MQLRRLRARNFRSHRDTTIDLSELTQACVTGDNGAGKSTLFVDAPLWALFGKAHAGLDEVIGHDGDKCSVELEVETPDGNILVSRGRVRGKTSSLVVGRIDGDKVGAIASGVAEAQAYIDHYLLHGRGYAEFVSSVYMVQGHHSAFTQASQAEAKRIFISLLALEHWEDRAKYVGKLRRDAEADATKAAALVESLVVPDEEDVIERRASLDSWLLYLESSKAKSDELLGKIAEAEDTRRAHDRWLDDSKALSVERDKLTILKDRLVGARKTAEMYESDLDVGATTALIAELTALKEEHDKWAHKVSLAEGDLERTDETIPHLEETLASLEAQMQTALDESSCPTCGQHVEGEATDKVKADFGSRISSLKTELHIAVGTNKEAKDKLAALDKEKPSYKEGALGKAQVDLERAREAKAHKDELDRLVELVDEQEQRVKGIEEKVGAEPLFDTQRYEELKGQRLDLVSDIKAKEQDIEMARSNLARAEAINEQRASTIERKKRAEAELKRLTDEATTYRTAEQAFGKDGIPAYLIDTSLPQVEQTTNELLDMMTDGSLSVSLVTQRDKKDGDSKDVLDIIVNDGLSERSFSTFSGGEGFRINFALRVALAELVSQRSGLDLSMLVVDEPEGLDASGREMLVQALGVISQRFGTIVLISHHDDLKDALGQRVVVTKAGGFSQARLETQ